MKHIYTILSLLTALLAGSLNAQELDPGWLWAQRGGSSASLSGLSDSGYERVVDVAIDVENNYYYLAEVGGFNFTLGDMEFATFNTNPQDKDIFIFSTDDEGNFRWSKTIGGGSGERAASIVVDDAGGVYASGTVFNLGPPDVHFDVDTIMNPFSFEPGPNNKKAFLIKYDSEGNFQWLRQPEEDAILGRSGAIVKTIVEPNGSTHNLAWLAVGSYFNDSLIVEEGKMQYVILKYNSEGDLENFIPLDMKPDDIFSPGFYNYQLAYDSNLDRYYVSDTYRSTPNPENPLGINENGTDSHVKSFYLAAVDNQGEVIWYHENQMQGGWSVGDIAIDETGDIYFTGLASTAGGPDAFAGFDFVFENGAPGGPGPFLIKLDADGNLIWGMNTQSYTPFNGQSIVVVGDNVYLGLGMLQNAWGDFAISGPSGMGLVPDIQIVKFDAQTGEALEVIQNNAITPSQDAIMAMTLDNNGDLVVGGYFGSQLFSGSDFHISNTGQDSDFFIAKYHLPADTTNDDTLGTINTINREAQMIRVYPNPTTGMVNLRSDIGLSSYTLHDLQGRVVAQGSLRGNQIDLSAREAGLYMLIVVDQEGRRYGFRIVRNE